ncbi:hypothetical protein CN918_25210 [Priestia megaterium]|nr:hypothetical protein CN918_25210 [Priestia megaterium]
MNKVLTPSKKLQKRIMTWLICGEVFISLFLLLSFIQTYSLTLALSLYVALAIAIVFGDRYIYLKLKDEYISLGITYIEWNGQMFDWDDTEEIRLKKENDKPMFLILRVSGEYHKIPLRLFAEQVEIIVEHIKSLNLKITE